MGIRLFIISLFALASISFSLYRKKQIDTYFNDSITTFTLSSFPADVVFTRFDNGKDQVLSMNGRKFVHFWATWCAPCEAELPDLYTYLKNNVSNNEKVEVIIVAVNDDVKKVKKFLKRFPDLSGFVSILIDNQGVSLSKFGVSQLPETFLFDNQGETFQKFSGPQDWLLPHYSKLYQAFKFM